MTRDEFQRWKTDPNTKEVQEVIRNHIKQLEFVLAREAGLDSASDRYKAGVLRGLELLLEIDWEDGENDQS